MDETQNGSWREDREKVLEHMFIEKEVCELKVFSLQIPQIFEGSRFQS